MSAVAETIAPAINKVQIGVATHLTPATSLSIKGCLDEFLSAVDECTQLGELKIIVDLGKAQVLDSLGITALMDIQDELLQKGGWLKVTSYNDTIADVGRITGLADYVTFLSSDGSRDLRSDNGNTFGQESKLGDILVARDVTNAQRIQEALDLQDKLGKRMGQILVDKGWASEDDVLGALGDQLRIPFVRLRPGLFDPTTSTLLDLAVAKRLAVMPLFRVRSVVYLATSKPQDMPSIEEVAERLQCKVRPVLARRDTILELLSDSVVPDEFQIDIGGDVDDDFAVVEAVSIDDYAEIDEVAAGSPVINLVNSIIQRAVHDGASDIHIEPFRTQSRIRFRIDGLLYEFTAPRIELHPAIVSRLKVMANLDIAERRLPQDGRIQVQTRGRSVDLRFSSLPGLHGEKVVLRILDKNQAILDVNKLNFHDENLSAFKQLLSQAHGLILVTGPTGSGKTTSLYAALNYLNSIEKNSVTIEDPVEYQLDIINQNEVRDAIGLSFARILKHVLRQDPDIVMVGEIRERDTAEIAVQAALTGHLVLSTLHTNDAIGAVTRLIDMGVESYLLSSALLGVVGQRLVRTICPNCRAEYAAEPQVVRQHGWDESNTIRLARGRGCEACYDSGYKGRMGIHEVLTTDPQLQKLIISNPSRDELSDYLSEREFRDLYSDGLDRVLEQRTTIEEVSRVTSL